MRTYNQMVDDQIASIKKNNTMTEQETYLQLDRLHKQRESLHKKDWPVSQISQLNHYYTDQIHKLRQRATLFIANLAQQAKAINCNVNHFEEVTA